MIRVLFLLLLAGCAAPQAPSTAPSVDPLLQRYPELDEPMPWDPGVRRGALPNGLQWYVEPNAEPEQRVELWLAVRAGSVQEDEDQLGLAHFVEHMAFNGTEHFPKNELIEYLESVGTRFGAHLNAHTSFEETVYKLQVPTDDPDIVASGFRVLRDWAGAMSFDPEELQKERGVVLEEWRRSRGAGGRARDALIPLTFHDARHAERLPIGTRESLEGFEPDAARRFYRDWYRPDLMAVFVVGDVDADAAQGMIESTFSDLTNPTAERERVGFPIPVHPETLYGAYADPEQSYSIVQILTKIAGTEQPDRRSYRERYVQRALAQVLNERLATIGRQPGAPFLQASVGRGRMSPLTESEQGFAVVKDGGTEAGLQALLVEVERARRHGVTEAELDRAKSTLLAGLERAWQERDTSQSRDVLQELLRNFTNGETVPGLDVEWEAGQRYLPGISRDEVNAYAGRFLAPQGRVVTAVVPERDGVEPPSPDALRRVVEGVASLDIEPPAVEEDAGPLLPELPAPGRVVSEAFDEATQTHEWTLSNGLTVLLKPTDFQADAIVFKGTSPGGYSLVSDEDYVAATTAVSIAALSGAGAFDAEQLARWFAGKVLSAWAYIGETDQGVQGNVRPADLEAAMQLIHARVVHPRFTQDAFDTARQQQAEWLRNRDANPATPFGDAFNRLLWQDHPRSRPWTVETLERMDLARSEALYRQRLGHWGDGVFAFVGALDLEAMRPLVERYLATLPTGTPEAWADVGMIPAAGRHEETVVAGLEAKAQVRIRFSGEFESAPETRHAARMLGKWLSMRLREVLREDLGGTYSVGAGVTDRFAPRQDYGVTIDFQCDPERVGELTEAAYAVIDEALSAPPDVSYPQRIAEQERRSLETNRRDNGFWLGALVGNRQRGEPRDALERYWSLHTAINPTYLHDAATTYIDRGRVVQVTLVPQPAD
jgi:zinc protease